MLHRDGIFDRDARAIDVQEGHKELSGLPSLRFAIRVFDRMVTGK